MMEETRSQVTGPKKSRPNKRAGQVCLRCHEKKIKCDIYLKTGPSRVCGNCTNSASTCLIRQSKRGTKRRLARPAAETERWESATQRKTPDASSTITSIDEYPTLHPVNFSLPEQSHGLDGHPVTQVDLPTAEGQHSRYGSIREVQPHQTHLGSTGYMQMFTHSNTLGYQTPSEPMQLDCPSAALQPIPDDLLDSYVETYFEYASVWCPVLDRESLQLRPQILISPLIQNALALCATRLRPPLMAHLEPILHYQRAKSLLYGNCESNPLLQIVSLMLFWWWSPGMPNVASLDTGRWWLGAAIRIAEEIGLHQRTSPIQPLIGETPGLRRRIWWTLFTRDRIVAMAQGRPCLINVDYCDQPMVTVDDFPDPTDLKAFVFVSWVQLWEIGGKIHREIYWAKEAYSPMPDLVQELIVWAKSLPVSLQLPFNTNRTYAFNRDVHDLHLSYLTLILLLYLGRSEKTIPTASIPAIAAASCITRIFKDYLARGSVRFVLPQASWSIALAILALLHARRIEELSVFAEQEIKTLHAALTQLAPFSYPGKMFSQGIQRLLDAELAAMSFRPATPLDPAIIEHPHSPAAASTTSGDGQRLWMHLFPYITPQTSPLVAQLLATEGAEMLPRNNDPEWGPEILPLLHELISDSHNFYETNLTLG